MAEEVRQSISDSGFIADVRRLGRLRAFLYKQALTVQYPPTPLSYAALSELNWAPTGGRTPTENERVTVDTQTEVIFRSLSEPLRRKFLMGELPWWLTLLPILFALIAVFALWASIDSVARVPTEALSAVARSIRGLPPVATTVTAPAHPETAPNTNPPAKEEPAAASKTTPLPIGARILPFYLLWLVTLGATGAIAFVGMNVLSVQDDATFDLTNTRLMVLRIVTGALFGLVLSLPFGYSEYVLFCIALVAGVAGAAGATDLTKQATVLLLPFVLGFSTSLVIMVLNQFIEGIQAFFGKKTVNVAPPSAPPLNPAAPLPPMKTDPSGPTSA